MILLGQKAAGWNAIWYNHRGHQAAGDVKPDAVVRSGKRIDCMSGKSAQRSERNMQ